MKKYISFFLLLPTLLFAQTWSGGKADKVFDVAGGTATIKSSITSVDFGSATIAIGGTFTATLAAGEELLVVADGDTARINMGTNNDLFVLEVGDSPVFEVDSLGRTGIGIGAGTHYLTMTANSNNMVRLVRSSPNGFEIEFSNNDNTWAVGMNAADQFVIADDADVSANERLVIDDTGAIIGIGNAAPFADLTGTAAFDVTGTGVHVEDGADVARLILEGQTASAITLIENDQAANAKTAALFLSAGRVELEAYNDDGTAKTADITVWDLTNSWLGIGTVPATELHVEDEGSTIVQIESDTNNDGADNDAAIYLGTNGTIAYAMGINDDVSDNFEINAGTSLDATPNVALKSTGELGVGISPTTGVELHIQNDTAGQTTAVLVANNDGTNTSSHAQFRFNVDDTGGDPYVGFNIGDGGLDWSIGVDNSDSDKFMIGGGTDSNDQLVSANTKLTILSSGNVGIGTNAPTYPLDLSGSTFVSNIGLRVDNTGGAAANLQLTGTTSGNAATDGLHIGMSGTNALIRSYENNDMFFYTNDVIRFGLGATESRFNTDGNDINFIVEASGVDSALVIDGTNGNVYMEGLATASGGELSLFIDSGTGQVVQGAAAGVSYGSMGFADSSETIAMTQNTWVKVTNGASTLYSNGQSAGDVSIAGDSMTVATAGVYEIEYDLSYSGANADVYQTAIWVNNAEEAVYGQTQRGMSGSDVGVVAGHAILSLSAADDISIRIRNTANNNDATIVAGNLEIHKL